MFNVVKSIVISGADNVTQEEELLLGDNLGMSAIAYQLRRLAPEVSQLGHFFPDSSAFYFNDPC